MAFEEDGYLVTDKKSGDTFGWDTQAEWQAYADKQRIGIPADYIRLAEVPIPQSVVSRYQFNEGSGSTATDSEGSNDGTINGATYTTDAPEGDYALDFDGSDDVNTGWLGPYGTNTWTISAVAKFRSSDFGTYSAVLGNYNGSFPQVKLSKNNNDNIELRVRDGYGGDAIFTWNNPQADTFYHIVGIRDGGDFYLYVNDDQKNSMTNSNVASDVRSGNVHVGARADANEFTNGIIDDVMLANGAWTASQVSDVYSIYTF